MMAEIEYLTRLKPAEDTGIELMQSVLREAPDRSVTVVVVSSLKDVAMWLQAEEALFVAKVATVVIQGGVEPFTTGVAGPDGYLVPDTAHNNQFDRQAAEFFYRRCQQVGIPLLVVSRFAAYAAPVPRTVYDELAATGSPIGKHLQSAQRRSIEQLWRRACAPDESEVRAGLPARCNKEWFCDTFCNGEGKGRDGGQSIWDVIVSFNMYDPLALVAALPTLSHLFEYDELVVGGVTHRVVGSSAQHTGIKDGAELRAWLGRNFRLGMSPETHTAVGGAIESRNSMGRPTATLPLTA